MVDVPDPSKGEWRLASVGICLWEPSPDITVPERPRACPVCGSRRFGPSERLSALLNPRFEGGFRYVFGVWVHPHCFETCIETSEPDPVPW